MLASNLVYSRNNLDKYGIAIVISIFLLGMTTIDQIDAQQQAPDEGLSLLLPPQDTDQAPSSTESSVPQDTGQAPSSTESEVAQDGSAYASLLALQPTIVARTANITVLGGQSFTFSNVTNLMFSGMQELQIQPINQSASGILSSSSEGMQPQSTGSSPTESSEVLSETYESYTANITVLGGQSFTFSNVTNLVLDNKIRITGLS